MALAIGFRAFGLVFRCLGFWALDPIRVKRVGCFRFSYGKRVWDWGCLLRVLDCWVIGFRIIMDLIIYINIYITNL